MQTCKICNQEFKNLKALSTHLNINHKITSKEYYDKFLIKESEGKCHVCNNQTTFRGINVGYLVNCSIECRNLNKTIKRDYWKGKKQSVETIKKRIENTNQISKQEKWEENNLRKLGVSNPSKLNEVKLKISRGNKGKKLPRDVKWQENIIKAKINNGTIKHNDVTKEKIKESLNRYYSENTERSKYISKNVNHLSGWYNNLHFRSSLELSFLINNQNEVFESCENESYKIPYKIGNKEKSYYPDFTNGNFIYEIKPKSLLKYKDNLFKIDSAKKVYGEKYKVITEEESPYVSKEIIMELIESKNIILSESSKDILARYKF